MIIRTTVSSAPILKELVEVLASRKYDLHKRIVQSSEDYSFIESSTVEAYMSGENQIREGEELLAVPYITTFVFTCVRTANCRYQLLWGLSLS